MEAEVGIFLPTVGLWGGVLIILVLVIAILGARVIAGKSEDAEVEIRVRIFGILVRRKGKAQKPEGGEEAIQQVTMDEATGKATHELFGDILHTIRLGRRKLDSP